jgi:hypothetical protein
MPHSINYYVSTSLPFDPAPIKFYSIDKRIDVAVHLLTLAASDYYFLTDEDKYGIQSCLAEDWGTEPDLIKQLSRQTLLELATGLITQLTDEDGRIPL